MLLRKIGQIFECVDLYRLNLKETINKFPEKNIKGYSFKVLNNTYEQVLYDFLNNRSKKYIGLIIDRINSQAEYMCFAFIENETGNIAHTRWVCFREFYSDVLKEKLILSNKEVITLDSYTHPDHRLKGLHTEMNKRMLNYLKEETDIEIVYIIIRCFYPYLHKVVRDLGYIRIKTKVYYKKGSIINFFKKIIKKFFKK